MHRKNIRYIANDLSKKKNWLKDDRGIIILFGQFQHPSIQKDYAYEFFYTGFFY
jgi:hypothetical protein